MLFFIQLNFLLTLFFNYYNISLCHYSSLSIFKFLIQANSGADRSICIEVNLKKFKELMASSIDLPMIYRIGIDSLLNFINEGEEFNLYVGRDTCPDCARINPYLFEYGRKLSGKIDDKLYYFDIDPFRDDKDEHYKYAEIKALCELDEISNPTMGWEEGKVPTLQHWKDGTTYDMITVYNDTIKERVVTSSYFTEERINNLPFLKDDKTLKNKVLQGLEVKILDSETETRNNYEQTYVNPIINLFLSTYVK